MTALGMGWSLLRVQEANAQRARVNPANRPPGTANQPHDPHSGFPAGSPQAFRIIRRVAGRGVPQGRPARRIHPSGVEHIVGASIMKHINLIPAAAIAAAAIGFSGCQQGDSETVTRLDGQVKGLSAKLDKMSSGTAEASDTSDLKTALASINKRLSGIEEAQRTTPGVSPAAFSALRDEVKALADRLNSGATVANSPIRPATGSGASAAGSDTVAAETQWFRDQLAAEQQRLKDIETANRKQKQRETSISWFNKRLESKLKDKGATESEIAEIKNLYEKQYDALQPHKDIVGNSFVNWDGGSYSMTSTSNSNVTKEQREDAQRSMERIRADTDASLKAAVSPDVYDAVSPMMKRDNAASTFVTSLGGDGGEFTGAIERVRDLAGAVPPAPTGTESSGMGPGRRGNRETPREAPPSSGAAPSSGNPAPRG
jgi:hypothetical protein